MSDQFYKTCQWSEEIFFGTITISVTKDIVGNDKSIVAFTPEHSSLVGRAHLLDPRYKPLEIFPMGTSEVNILHYLKMKEVRVKNRNKNTRFHFIG